MATVEFERVRSFTAELWVMLGGDPARVDRLEVVGKESLISPYPVTDLAAATVATVGLAAAELVEAGGAPAAPVTINRVLTSAWCRHASSQSVAERPRDGGRPLFTPPASGGVRMIEFETRDRRWLRLQANYAGPRERILRTLGVSDNAEEVAAAVATYDADEIEQAIVDNGGTVAASRTVEEWLTHPQGAAVANEALLDIDVIPSPGSTWQPTPGRPLAGIKVLDMTRVLAGPTATSILGGLGADVIRIEAPDGDEISTGGDHLLGKRWALLDLKNDEGRDRFLELLSTADIFVHGYRPGALDGLGIGEEVRAATRPGLIEATLNAYGWTGPWNKRRGFDTIMQFSTGLATANTAWAAEDPAHRQLDAMGSPVDLSRPRMLPIQILDYGAGFLLAASALRGLTRRLTAGEATRSRTALARFANKLIADGQVEPSDTPVNFPLDGPFEDHIFTTPRGPVRRLRFPVHSEQAPIYWERSWEVAGASAPRWNS